MIRHLYTIFFLFSVLFSAPATAGSCLTSVKLCSNVYLCQLAAPNVTNGKKAWFSSSSKYYKYVVEAKKRGLSCGVGSASLTPTDPTDVCPINLIACADKYICKIAAPISLNGKRVWLPNYLVAYKFVIEAKNRGLSCGTTSTSAEPKAGSNLPNCPSDTNARWHNCFGTTTFASGSKYVGEWKDDKLTGQGTYTWANGDKYVGEWKNNKSHGHGIYTELNGFKYVGAFKDDKWNGYGTAKSGDGDTFIGMWKDNFAVKGKVIFANGDIYVGKIDKKGNAIGEGTYVYANGDKYVGEWRTDKKNGQGTITFASGSIYVGDWKNDKRTGQGTFTYGPKSKWAGDKYVGGWKNDKRNGKGKYTYADGTIKEGIWENGKLQGLKTASAEPNAVSNLPNCPSDTNARWHNCFGTYTFGPESEWAGDKYVGEWKDNNRTGQGTYIFGAKGEWAGDTYVGEFKDDKRTGQGTYTWANGNKYVGEYKDGKRNGQGTFTWSNGTVEEIGRASCRERV